jgi:hypothetical protein
MTTAMTRALPTMMCACALLASGTAGADSACIPDAQRFCPDVPFGEGRVLTCLQSRWSELASTCQQEIQSIENRSREINSACAADVWQWCRNVAPGGDRIRVCLWSRWNDLSSICRDEASRLAEKAQQFWNLCAADAEQLCTGMKPGGGLVFLCLKAQESSTSSQCRNALR